MVKLGLKELQEMIKKGIESAIPKDIWVRAEVHEVKLNYSGHCYLSLVEKQDGSAGILAKAQAIIWSSTYRVLAPYFLTTAGSEISVGMNLLLKVQVQYSVLYGLSLIVSDIDPTFTIGEMVLQRQKTLNQLQAEGVIDMNSILNLPSLPRNLAIISSDTAAGYQDFISHLLNNEYGFRFSTKIYGAIMQGDMAVKSIIKAMEDVINSNINYDALLITRGGGAAIDMICFDDYDLAFNVAQYPIPVFSAIGHDKDFHVLDVVAHTSVKTPTALANYFIDLYLEQDARLVSLGSMIYRSIKDRFANEDLRLERTKQSITSSIRSKINVEDSKLNMLWYRLNNNNPIAMLERGFALLQHGAERRIDGAKGLNAGDMIEILLKDGLVKARVEKVELLNK